MMWRRLWKRLSKGTKRAQDDAEIAALRRKFKERYKSFQRLLASNKHALSLMTELEAALDEARPVSMAFIRSRSTRVAVDVFQMLRHLSTIAPKKHEKLFDRFEAIRAELDESLSVQPADTDGPLIVPLSEVDLKRTEQVGGKMASLGELSRIEGIRIPSGFVITSRAYRLFIDESGLRDHINQIIQTTEPDGAEALRLVEHKIQKRIMSAALPKALEEAITMQSERLFEQRGARPLLAMRSSALGEDGDDMSYAGQYRSVLNVSGDDVLFAYKAVVAGKYSARAMSYRHHYGIRDDETAMCAGCMPMIDALYGGVVYTVNPLDSDDDAVYVYAVDGLPEQVVNGSGDVDTFAVERGARLENVTRRTPSARPTIDPPLVLRLATAALEIERHFGRPQDIEWAVEKSGQIVLLQSRPLTKRFEKGTAQSDEILNDVLLEGGITASGGRSSGPVFFARTPKDAAQFADGAVLVTAQPLPIWAPLLNRASALVSEQGTAACHLANVAREYRVPAVFGLPSAMSALENGALVTVDADQRRLYAGRAAAITPPVRRRAPQLKRSPIYQTLAAVSERIVPLHLIDPNDARFVPEACETLHDITRYCHEMAVKEMFQFGMDSEFPKAAARRLFTDVATQFWIIDLDDGVADGADDPYFITLDQVQSVPMMAIWRGMNAEVWDGPPPVNARGMMDLMLKSTMDPNLNPATHSEYSTGNHFMISKNYCSLQSRFGYHFATVEALVGPRPIENFINFQFGGGGTHPTRQQRRARLLEEILVDRGFQVNRKRDLVNAQKGGFDEPLMRQSLETIGYLLVHTRQLDMAMTDETSYRKYKDKLDQGLRKVGL